MNKPDKNKTSEKENKKVQTDKQFKDNEVHEGKADSINNETDTNKSAYPYKHAEDKQHKMQEEYLDRNNDSKDKS